jgi:hypothetical protein
MVCAHILLIYFKDFIFTDTYADRRYNLLNFTVTDSYLTGSAIWWQYSDMPFLDKVTVLGIQKPVKSVFVNQASKPFSYHTINKVGCKGRVRNFAPVLKRSDSQEVA